MKKAGLIFFLTQAVFMLHAQIICDNIPPVAIAGKDTIILNGQTSCNPVPVIITLDGSNSFDPDGTIVNFSWSNLWGGINGITNPGSAVTTVTGLVSGNYQYVLKVTDNNGAVDYDTVHILIVPPTRPLIQTQLISIGTLSEARNGITMAASNNKIVIAGGGAPPGYCATSRVDIYDINTNSWSTAELSEARNGMGVAVLGNKIFFGGGFSPKPFPNSNPPVCYIGNIFYPETRSSAVDIYDASSNTWSASQLSDRRAPEGAAAGNKVIFAGGDLSDVAIPSNVVNIYDVSSNSWTTTTLAEPKSLPQIATAGNKMYLAGGGASLDADNHCLCFSKRIDIYDALSDLWSVDSLSKERAEMGSISANNKIFWAGGWIYSTDPNSYYPEITDLVEIRDLATNTTSFDCLSQPREGVTALRKDNKLLFFDGSVTFDIYDLATNSWSIGVLPLPLYNYSVVSHNDSLYIAGGYLNNYNTPSYQVWKLKIDGCINSSSSSITASACDAYTLNGKVYRASGLYRQTLVNTAGCDSTITLNLTVHYSTNCTTSVNACDSYTWQGQTYTTSGLYSDTLVSSNGCDSILNLNLLIAHITNTTISATACKSYTWQGQTYTMSGIYSDTLVSSSGCDSILTLNLVINSIIFSSINAAICSGQSYEGHTASGTYVDTLVTANGCDSIRTLSLSVKPASTSTIDTAICPGQNYYGHTSSGTYTDIFTGANGCDSLRTLNLAIKTNCSFYIPNSFTPNRDGLNDLFKPTINLSIQNFSFVVFNRYGEKIFDTRNYGTGWDGKYKGKDQPTGSYVYRITFTNISGHVSENNGTVLLIR